MTRASPRESRDATRREGFLATSRRRVFVFDGGLGTRLRSLGAPEGGCPELWNETHADLVYRAHADFLAAGARAVTTNSFGAAAHMLVEHLPAGQNPHQRSFEVSRKAAEIARRAVDGFPRATAPRRFVAGSIGPGSKLPSLGQIDFADLLVGYRPQVEGLLAGGADCLIIETCQDLLQVKAALVCIEEVFERLGRRVPVIAQVTIDEHGRTLLGSDMPAVLAALDPFPVAAIGLNCGLGPEHMTAAVRHLAGHSPKLLSLMPNAGLPRLVGGRAVYDLSPRDFAEQMKRLATGAGLNIAGGCCGTTPEHIAALVGALRGVRARRPVPAAARLSSLFRAQDIDVRPKPLLCGERTNASGSRKFRALLQAREFDAMVQVARAQKEEGAHLIDLSVAAAGHDERADMSGICLRLNAELDLPVMVDSRDPRVVEAALQRLAGRCVVNSVSLEDRARAEATISLCSRYGAALVLLAIDEQGMAMTTVRKLEVAARLFDLAVTQGGLAPEGVFFDFLTFTLGSGEESLRGAAHETLRAIREAKRRFPRSFTVLGVSNVSHGLAPDARRALNSVFLHHAIEHGLDAAILHAGRIEPLGSIDPVAARLCDDLIFDRAREGRAALARLLDHFAPGEGREERAAAGPARVSAADRLRGAVIAGDVGAVREALPALLRRKDALAIIERDLLGAMAEVGAQFEAGEMLLPFVLRSATAMRAALDLLEPHLGAARAVSRGTLVLATVRGDIHDIGKNLVDMILSSNGFKVVNLGVGQTAEAILVAVRAQQPDAIGLSGLLVESARAMKEYVEAFAASGVTLPVICGGAALTREYVERDLQTAYPGRVHYAKDVMAGLRIMQRIVQPGSRAGTRPGETRRHTPAGSRVPRTARDRPSYMGARVHSVAVARLEKLLDRRALFQKRWQMLPARPTRAQTLAASRTLREMLRRTTRRGLWRGRVVAGLFRARIEGEELVLLHPTRDDPLTGLGLSPGFCRRLARHHGARAFPVALQLVTVGHRVVGEAKALAARGDIHGQFLLHGLAAELTEALAEHAQRRLVKLPGVRRTARYSPGYPIWPSLSEQTKVFALLRPERIGVTLTESFQMVPEYTPSAIVVPRA